MNKKFIFVLLVFFPAFISFAQGGNEAIESFSKAKKILRKFILIIQLHFIVAVNIRKIFLIGNPVGFHSEKIKNEHLG